MPNYVHNLQPYFGDCPEAWRWLQETWLPEEAAHGRLTRQFVERHWPEFEWEVAYAHFLRSYVPRCNHTLLRPSPALEALARCVTETEAAMIYRCLGAYTTNVELGALLDQMSRDEVRHYAYFRSLFDRFNAVEQNSFWRRAKTILARSELVCEEDLALAFAPLNQAWRGPIPFEPLSYAELLERTAEVMSRHFPLEAAKRMLFRPLLSGRAWERVIVGILFLIVRKP